MKEKTVDEISRSVHRWSIERIIVPPSRGRQAPWGKLTES